MSDLRQGISTRQHLIQTLLPDPTPGVDTAETHKLSEIVVAPEEVLLTPVSPVAAFAPSDYSDLYVRLKKEIDFALGTIDDPKVRVVAESVLQEISQLFARLAWIETNLRKLDTLQENLSIFEMLQVDIHSLVNFIESEALPTENLGDKLYDVLARQSSTTSRQRICCISSLVILRSCTGM